MSEQRISDERRRQVQDVQRRVVSLLAVARATDRELYKAAAGAPAGPSDEYSEGLLKAMDDVTTAVRVLDRARVLIRAELS